MSGPLEQRLGLEVFAYPGTTRTVGPFNQPDRWINDMTHSGRGHPRQCRAHSSRTGERCGKYAIRGAPTCRSHGSAAGHVRRAARLRLAALTDPAIDVLTKHLVPGRTTVRPELQLRAAVEVLNRAGLRNIEEAVVGLDQTSPSGLFSCLTDAEVETLLTLARRMTLPPLADDR